MTGRLFLLILLASMIVLPTSVKATEPVEWDPVYYLGGEGKLIGMFDGNLVQEDVNMCVVVAFPEYGYLVGGMSIRNSAIFDENFIMFFTGSVLDKKNMRITFIQEPIAFAVGSFDDDKTNRGMNFVIQIPGSGITNDNKLYGGFTGNFELTQEWASGNNCPGN